MDTTEHALQVGQLLDHVVERDGKLRIGEQVVDGIEAVPIRCGQKAMSRIHRRAQGGLTGR